MNGNIRTGIDIVDINRIEKILNKNRDSFLSKIFTREEIGHINFTGNKPSKVAGLFSAKEAVAKLIGSGIGSLNWKDIEISHKENGKPYICINEKIGKLLGQLNISSIDISISHERQYAIAMAVGLNVSKLKEESPCRENLNTEIPSSFKENLAKRKSNSHKGSYGRVAIIAGSKGMTGASYLCSQSALRSGSGLVYSVVPKSIEEIMSIKLTEVIVKSVEDDGKGYFTRNSLPSILNEIENMDAIAIGPGIGVDRDRLYILEEIMKNYHKPIILDADAINCLSIKPNLLYNRIEETIITPHPGELARFLGKSIEEVQANRIFYCKYASDKYNIMVALKGSQTVVTYPGLREVYVNNTGNPGMATAGSGDVLTGMIVSFIGQGIKSIEALKLAVFAHGLAGDLAVLDKGEYSLIASDIIENIYKSINKIQN